MGGMYWDYTWPAYMGACIRIIHGLHIWRHVLGLYMACIYGGMYWDYTWPAYMAGMY